MAKLAREYHMFQYSVVILLGSFIAALIVLAGAEFAARRARADDGREYQPPAGRAGL
jgi:hypothetical protein